MTDGYRCCGEERVFQKGHHCRHRYQMQLGWSECGMARQTSHSLYHSLAAIRNGQGARGTLQKSLDVALVAIYR